MDLETDCQGCIQTGSFQEPFADNAVWFAQNHADLTGHTVIVEQGGLSMVVKQRTTLDDVRAHRVHDGRFSASCVECDEVRTIKADGRRG